MIWISPSQYAKHRDVKPSTITRHVQRGNIPKSAIKQTKKGSSRILINVELADIAMSKCVDSITSGGGKKDAKTDTENSAEFAQYIEYETAEPENEADRSLTDAKMRKEYFMAALKQIELEKQKARLLDRDEVEKFQFNRDRQIRDSLLNIPDRLSAIIAAMQDATEQDIHDVLLKEINASLQELSK